MGDQADRMITALRAGHDELAVLVGNMTADDLTQPSAAAEWDISQVLSHLGSGAEIALAALEAALEGTSTPGSEFNQSVWARWDATTPSERAEGFPRADEALVRRYESLDSTARTQLRIDLGFLPEAVDVATAAGLRLSEFTYHFWDIRGHVRSGSGTGPRSGRVAGRSVGRADGLPRTLRRARRQAGNLGSADC